MNEYSQFKDCCCHGVYSATFFVTANAQMSTKTSAVFQACRKTFALSVLPWHYYGAEILSELKVQLVQNFFSTQWL